RRGHARQHQRQLGAARAQDRIFLRDLRRGVADRDQHREHLRRSLRLGGTHREERVQERAVQAEVAGRDEVADVVENRRDLGARADAILLDLMMPGMNGRQFLQALRDDPAYASVPVLIMTAVHGLELNLATIGASEVVEKPFKNVDELLNKVALAVYRSRDAD